VIEAWEAQVDPAFRLGYGANRRPDRRDLPLRYHDYPSRKPAQSLTFRPSANISPPFSAVPMGRRVSFQTIKVRLMRR